MTYLDYAASCPIDPGVADAVSEALSDVGNPSSVHEYGRIQRVRIDAARAQVAALLGAEAGEIVFTSGATEANVSAVVGAYRAAASVAPGGARPRVALTAIEHASVREAAAFLEREHGAAVDTLPVGPDGTIDVARAVAAIGPDTVLVCVMWTNNVTGAIQPVRAIADAVLAERARREEHGGPPILLFTDAVQAVRTQDVLVSECGADLLSISAHKVYGPKGVGALYVRRGTPFVPMIVGGGQEAGRRSGTENVPGIVGLGAACDRLRKDRPADRAHAGALQAVLARGLEERRIPVEIVGGEAVRSPDIAYLVDGRSGGDTVAVRLDAAGIAVSSGSACDAGKRGVPAALAAMGRGERSGIRISFGRSSTERDIARFLDALSSALR